MSKINYKNFSQITIDDCKEYLQIEKEFTDDDNIINTCLVSAKSFILDECGFNEDLLNLHALYSVNLLYYVVSELYHQRIVTTTNIQVSPMFQQLLNKVRVFNLA